MFDDATVKTLTMNVSGLNNVEIGNTVKNQLLKVLPRGILLIIDEYLKEICVEDNCNATFYSPGGICAEDTCCRRYCSGCFDDSFCQIRCESKKICGNIVCGYECWQDSNSLLYVCDDCYDYYGYLDSNKDYYKLYYDEEY